MAHVSFKGKVAASGNSGALRLEAGFFRTHPLFAAGCEIVAEPIGDDMVLVRALSKNQAKEDTDPVMNAFLSFIENDMIHNPDSIEPISKQELDEIAELVEGVEIE